MRYFVFFNNLSHNLLKTLSYKKYFSERIFFSET